ncbi:hypothetical protein [Qipengyuania sp. RANM35]|uniref:hypothetical protein n=1 Tax=Qipengyuania sp. RANM35 TaxID=3068635 RepID=UPI0034DB5BD8
MNLRPISALAALALVSACGDNATGPKEGEAMDPASQQALNDELMTDPDLANRNEAGAALSGTGNDAVPEIDKSTRAIEAARTRAVELVGGTANMKPAPAARQLAANAPDTKAMVAAAKAAVTPGGANCADSVEYGAAWAAKLPATFPVYPRGNTQEAAGTDEGDCALRIVTFLTPVEIDEIFAFYASRATAAGYAVEHVLKGEANILSGTKGKSAVVVYATRLPSDVTQIDLVTSE